MVQTRVKAMTIHKWLNSGYVFKAESTGFADNLDVGCMRKRELKNDYKLICMSNWKGMELPSTEMRLKAASKWNLFEGWRQMTRSVLDMLNLGRQMGIWTAAINLEVINM